MCGRYVFAIASEKLEQTFREQHDFQVDEVRARDRARESYNVGPSSFAPVVFADFQLEKPEYSRGPSSSRAPAQTGDSRVVAQYMKWGLLPFWAKEPKKFTAYRTFNAKVETLVEGNRLWSPSVPHHRCLVPVQGYYEWLHSTKDNDLDLPRSKKTTGIPYYIRHRNPAKLLFLAGLWSHTQAKDESEGERDIFTYTIITGPAPKQLSWLHERMPVVVRPGSPEWDRWLDTKGEHTTLDDKQLRAVLKPYDGDDLVWFEVSQEVNKTSNDGERLIKPVKRSNSKDIASLVGVKKEDQDQGQGEGAADHAKPEPEDQSETSGSQGAEHAQDSKLQQKVKKEGHDAKTENGQSEEVPVVAGGGEESEVEEDDVEEDDVEEDDVEEDDEEEELGDDGDEKESGDKRKGESHPASRTRKRTRN